MRNLADEGRENDRSGTRNRPCDAVVMAIVDEWVIGNEQVYTKYSPDHGYGDTE